MVKNRRGKSLCNLIWVLGRTAASDHMEVLNDLPCVNARGNSVGRCTQSTPFPCTLRKRFIAHFVLELVIARVDRNPPFIPFTSTNTAIVVSFDVVISASGKPSGRNYKLRGCFSVMDWPGENLSLQRLTRKASDRAGLSRFGCGWNITWISGNR